MGVFKNWRPLSGSPYSKAYNILGSFLESPMFGNSHVYMVVATNWGSFLCASLTQEPYILGSRFGFCF